MKSETKVKEKKQPKPLPPSWEQGLLDAPQCQALMACSHAHFHQLNRENKFPAPAIRSSRYTRWHGSAVKAWLDDPAGFMAANKKSSIKA